MKPEFEEIFAQYARHGWVLRRVLLAAASEYSPGPVSADVTLVLSDINAAWFSRPPKPGEYAWEIRYLGPTPFAFVEHLDDSAPDFEQRLQDVENRLRKVIASKARGH
jgi:hypothetical protein